MHVLNWKQAVRFLGREERGVGLVDVIVGMAIAGVVLSVLITALFRFGQGMNNGNAQIAIARRMEDASAFLATDVGQAKYTSLVSGATAVNTMTLFWTDYYSNAAATHKISYSLSGTNLQRTYDGTTSTVGKSVTSATFSLSGKVVSVNLTISDTENDFVTSQSKTYQFFLRSAP